MTIINNAEGIFALPGGGVALSRCVNALDKLKLEGDEQIGVNIVRRALQEPLRQIAVVTIFPDPSEHNFEDCPCYYFSHPR